jgi:RsiW-degrading membrane proteinase PrsW (M82 family)
LIEEFAKYLAVTIVAFSNKSYDEPIDAMIYMITAAIGFAAVENSLFLFKTIHMGLSGFDFLFNGNLRFLGATLLHICCSALVGGVIGLSFAETGWSKVTKIVFAVLVAALLHALFNFFIISSSQNIIMILIALWFLIVAIMILFEKIKRINTNYVQ